MENNTPAELLQPTFDPMQLDPKKAVDLENGVNQGVIAPTEDELGEVSADVSGLTVTCPDSNWDRFLSDFDPQSNSSFDTLACNIFSSTHCNESLVNALGGDGDYKEDGKTEFSERQLCVACGLNGSTGSSEDQYENGLLAHGTVKHSLWPFNPNMTKTEFFAPLPDAIKSEALKFKDKYEIKFRRVGVDRASLVEALKYAPVKIFIGTGAGWNQGEPNVIPKTNNWMNHAVMVRRVDDQGIHIYDQYAPYLKVLAPDYVIYYAFQTILIKKGNPMFKVKKVKINGAYGALVDTPNATVITKAEDEDEWRSYSKSDSYGIHSINTDGSTDFSVDLEINF